MRQLIFSRLAGYEDTNDAERLSLDPTLREKLIKIGAKVVRHARQVIFQMARAAIIPSVARNPILERRQRLGIGLSALSKVIL